MSFSDTLIFQISYELATATQIPYIANRSRWKSLVVAKLNCNSVENTHGWMVVLYGQSLFAQAILLEKFHSYQSIHKTFPPQAICNMQ